jgi:RNA-binding protein
MNSSELYLLAGRKLSKKEIVSEAKTVKPIVQIGKNGLSEGSLEEIRKHLKKRKLIKIKCLRYFLEDENKSNREKATQIAQEIAQKLEAEIITIVGFTFVLYKS